MCIATLWGLYASWWNNYGIKRRKTNNVNRRLVVYINISLLLGQKEKNKSTNVDISWSKKLTLLELNTEIKMQLWKKFEMPNYAVFQQD